MCEGNWTDGSGLRLKRPGKDYHYLAYAGQTLAGALDENECSH